MHVRALTFAFSPPAAALTTVVITSTLITSNSLMTALTFIFETQDAEVEAGSSGGL
jgi:hypothetical protein